MGDFEATKTAADVRERPLKEHSDIARDGPQTSQSEAPQPAIASFFSRRRGRDLEEIATQPSVYDDPKLAPYFQPNPKYENLHRFDPEFKWKWGEEKVKLFHIYMDEINKLFSL